VTSIQKPSINDLHSQLNFIKKPVNVLNYDMIVKFNGRSTVEIEAGTPLNYMPDILSVSVSLGIDNCPGTANISIAAGTNSKYFKFGRCAFSTMYEVEIFTTGRYLVGNEGKPRYYPIFWGFVTNVSYNWSGGVTTIDLQCKDILYWWQLSPVNLIPQVATVVTDSRVAKDVLNKSFANCNPFEVLVKLSSNVTPGIIPDILTSQSKGAISGSDLGFDKLNQEFLAYWKDRFDSLSKGVVPRSLRMYGMAGQAYDIKAGKFVKNLKPDSGAAEQTTDAAKIPPIDSVALSEKDITDVFLFKADTLTNMFTDLQAQMTTNLDVANIVKRAIGFEFFMDVTGELVFKPPFYNLDVKNNSPISIIDDTDIIAESYDENADEIITKLDVIGSLPTDETQSPGGPGGPKGSFLDYHLVRKYGVRFQEITMANMHSAEQCIIYAMSELSRHNSNIYTASLTIPLRPELRLGYPIYIKSQDCYWYVTNINHNFTFGESAQTQLTLTSPRRKYVTQNSSGKIIGATNNTGVANMTLAYQDPIPAKPTPDTSAMTLVGGGEQDPSSKAFTNKWVDIALTTDKGAGYQANNTDQVAYAQGKNTLTNYQGSYAEVAKVWSSINSVSDRLKYRPISDENGYEIIGLIPFGLGLSVSQNGGISFSTQTSANSTAVQLQNISVDERNNSLIVPDVDIDTYNANPLRVSSCAFDLYQIAPDRDQQ
jgi:hypothetical protein